MTKRLSFTKNLNKLLPKFRENMNSAESTEDVRKFFLYAAKELLEDILERELDIREDDISFLPEKAPYFKVSDRLISEIKEVWKESDLPHLLERLAEAAFGRYKHLEKHPEKTESKIRM